MKLKHIYVTLVALFFSLVAFAQFSPMTTSPDPVEIAPGEQCVKEPGRLKCRWDGECAKVGNKCMSCMKDQLYSEELGQCYTCPSGTSLTRENNSWVCK